MSWFLFSLERNLLYTFGKGRYTRAGKLNSTHFPARFSLGQHSNA